MIDLRPIAVVKLTDEEWLVRAVDGEIGIRPDIRDAELAQ